MTEGTSGLRPPEIAGFENLVMIGRGGFSTVYSADQVGLHRRVAIKVLTGGDESPQGLERELRALGALADVPHIVTAHAVVTTAAGQAALVMPLFGQSLAQRVRVAGPQPIDQVCLWTLQLATCLDRIHERGVVHRDVKPENVLLDEAADVFLTDFGIAGLEQLASRTTTVMSISPPHSAPERLRGDESTPVAGDIYSLASTMYFALAGRSPFGTTSDGGAHGLIERIATAPLPASGVVQGRVLEALQKGMAKDPAQRYTSALDLATALAEATSDSLIVPLVGPRLLELDDDQTVHRAELFLGESRLQISPSSTEPQLPESGRPIDALDALLPVRVAGASAVAASPQPPDQAPSASVPVVNVASEIPADPADPVESVADSSGPADEGSGRVGGHPSRRNRRMMMGIAAAVCVAVVVVAAGAAAHRSSARPRASSADLVVENRTTEANPLPAALTAVVDGDSSVSPSAAKKQLRFADVLTPGEGAKLVLKLPENVQLKVPSAWADHVLGGDLVVVVTDDAVTMGKVRRQRHDPAERRERLRIAALIETTRSPVSEAGARFKSLWDGPTNPSYPAISSLVEGELRPALDQAISDLDGWTTDDPDARAAVAARRACVVAHRDWLVREATFDRALSQAENEAQQQASLKAISGPCSDATMKAEALR